MCGLFLSVICHRFHSLFCLLGLLFLEPMAYLLGSTDTILPHAKAYMGIVLLGAPWMTASLAEAGASLG